MSRTHSHSVIAFMVYIRLKVLFMNVRVLFIVYLAEWLVHTHTYTVTSLKLEKNGDFK